MTRRTVVAIVAVALAVAGCSRGVVRNVRAGGAAREARDGSRFRISGSSPLPGAPGGFAVDDHGTVVQVDNEQVVAIDTGGEEQWSAPLVGAAYGRPWLGDGVAVVPTLGADDLSRADAGPGGCVALDRATGERRWSYEEAGRSGVAVAGAGDRIYCVFGDAVIVAIDSQTGDRVWRARFEPDSPTDMVVVQEGTAVVVDEASKSLAFVVIINDLSFLDVRDLRTGADLDGWELSRFQPSSAPVATRPGEILIASGGQQVCTFDLLRRVAAACANDVPAPDGFDPASVPVVTTDGLVVVVGRDGSVSAIDLDGMNLRWTTHVEQPCFDAKPVASAGVVVFADGAGNTRGLRLADGSNVDVPSVAGSAISTAAGPSGGVAVAMGGRPAGRIQWLRPTG